MQHESYSQLRDDCFRCLACWVMGGTNDGGNGDTGGWVTLEDLSTSGVLTTLERELKTGPQALGVDSYILMLQVGDAPSYYLLLASVMMNVWIPTMDKNRC